jgi:outer membrane protein
MKNISIPFVFLSCFLAQPAFGQHSESGKPSPKQGWEVSVGAGAILSPKYLGDNEYGLNLVPSIRISYEDRFTASVEGGIRYNVINTDNVKAGPLARINFGRDEDGNGAFRISGGDTNDLVGLGDIDTTVSLGGFAEYELGNMVASVEAGQALGGHDGLTGEIGLRYKGRAQFNGPPLIYSIGPKLNFGDATYTNAYFGVDAAQSAASGLSQYQADGGLVSYGISGTAILPLTQNIGVTFIASFDRLSGDAADAPLVEQRGSRDQGFVGGIFSYTFD